MHMYHVSGYLGSSSEEPITRADEPLLVTSCGQYRLSPGERLTTDRPHGRPDYQLLYVAGGAVRFVLDGETCDVGEGQAVLYRPGQAQHYDYLADTHPAACWVHFTGRDACVLLDRYGWNARFLLSPGVSSDIPPLFDKITRELQIKRPHFLELGALYLQQLLLLCSRSVREKQSGLPPQNESIDQAIAYLHAHFQEPFGITAYARANGMSPSWFSRLFQRQTGLSPRQYLQQVRMAKAKELLVDTRYRVGEVAAMIGCRDPLYFSRLFHQATGLSPLAYRRRAAGQSAEP